MVDRGNAEGNIQPLVARHSRRAFFAVLLFQISDKRLARAFLARWKEKTPAVSGTGHEPDLDLHFAFSWNGLAKLLEDKPEFDLAKPEFEPSFVDPAQAPDGRGTAPEVGFLGDSSPERWWNGVNGFKTADIDLAVHVGFDSQDKGPKWLAELRASAISQGLKELKVGSFPDGVLAGNRPHKGILHFGYKDGISKDEIDDWNWSDTKDFHRINFRESILGYPNSTYHSVPEKPGKWQDFAKEGSFACLTWIQQDVARFNQFLRDNVEAARPYAGSADPEAWLKAKLLGRWPTTGAPLALDPDADPPKADLDKPFGYADDPLGLKCPLTAHIRIVNSRDQKLEHANEVRFPAGPPRLIRRGFSYGKTLDEDNDETIERGLIGFFFCSRINEQFYTILRWMYKAEFSDAFDRIPRAQDTLTGHRAAGDTEAKTYIPLKGEPPLRLSLRNFIRYRGVAVLFAPSLKSLRLLAGE